MSSEKPSLEGLRIDRAAAAQQPKPAWLLPTLLGLLAAAGVGAWWLTRAPTLEVETAVARSMATQSHGGEARTLLNATGYVTARRQATVSSKITGKVVQLNVEEGLWVRSYPWQLPYVC